MGDHYLPEDSWLLRPCLIYQAEYEDCTSREARRYQMFIEGVHKDCSKWMQDFKNCQKYWEKNDITALENLIANEKERREKRLHGARNNNVWEYRTKPPMEWNDPLPEHLAQNRLPSIPLNDKSTSWREKLFTFNK